MSRTETRSGLLLVALLSCLGPLGLTLHGQLQHGAAAVAEQQAAETLKHLRTRQLAWFRNNQNYATRLEELGVSTPSDGWHYQMIAARIDGHPGVTLEAESGGERLVIDPAGKLMRSRSVPLPLGGAWRAPPKGIPSTRSEKSAGVGAESAGAGAERAGAGAEGAGAGAGAGAKPVSAQ